MEIILHVIDICFRKMEYTNYYEVVSGSGQMEKITPRLMELFVTHDHAAKEQADSQLTWLQLEEHPVWLSRGTLERFVDTTPFHWFVCA